MTSTELLLLLTIGAEGRLPLYQKLGAADGRDDGSRHAGGGRRLGDEDDPFAVRTPSNGARPHRQVVSVQRCIIPIKILITHFWRVGEMGGGGGLEMFVLLMT